jgi:hypothetical protein
MTANAELTATNSESTPQDQSTQHDIIKIHLSDIIEKNNACLCGSNHFQRVTASHGHCHTLTEQEAEDIAFQAILSTIRDSNGSHMGVNAAIGLVQSQNEQVRNYLGDNITSRGNRKVRDLCLKIIRHRNIEVIKYKPQLIVRWIDEESFIQSKSAKEENDSTTSGSLYQ